MYLKINTNSALAITGEWGSSKTYYYKNTIEQLITKTKVIECEHQYRSVLVSLFGLKSIEDIQTEIILALTRHLKTKV